MASACADIGRIGAPWGRLLVMRLSWRVDGESPARPAVWAALAGVLLSQAMSATALVGLATVLASVLNVQRSTAATG